MQITLHESNFMWTLLTKPECHVSDEAPGPIDIDWNSLTNAEKQLVINGIKKNMITSNVDISTLQVQPLSPVKSVPFITKVPKKVSIEQTQQIYLDSIHPMLNQTFATVKKEVGATSDVRLLRTMLAIETENKNRKNVVALIEERLTYLMDKVQSNIDNDKTVLIMPIEPTDVTIANSMDVIDSEEKIVTVPVDGLDSLDIT